MMMRQSPLKKIDRNNSYEIPHMQMTNENYYFKQQSPHFVDQSEGQT